MFRVLVFPPYVLLYSPPLQASRALPVVHVLGDRELGSSVGFGDPERGAGGISTSAFDVYDMLLHRSIQTS